MGHIKQEVYDKYLSLHPEEEALLKPFLNGFNISHGGRRRIYRSDIAYFFLEPEAGIRETYGFNQEILLIYSSYQTIEPRTIQAAEELLATAPAKGRVDNLSYILVSEDPNVRRWVSEYILGNQEARIIVTFFAQDLRDNRADTWFVRNALNLQHYSRDLFDYRLPLEKDTYFFGREDIVLPYHDSINRAENKGIFGLRKTGKTSLIFKLKRMLQSDRRYLFLYYDCKSPSIRMLRWNELLQKTSEDISQFFPSEIKLNTDRFNEKRAADTFARVVSGTPSDSRIVLVFDEIEYISPIATMDKHWHQDFIPFWQSFWDCQSRFRRISAIIAGVNPTIVEADTFGGIQNPLFGIVSYQFLRGLGRPDLARMLRILGRRMGLVFEDSAIDYLGDRYGGHPLLTRIACSILNSSLTIMRPTVITVPLLQRDEDSRDSDLVFYCRHVVSELRQFYPDEYSMLELLATKRTRDFLELSEAHSYIKHLLSYGIIEFRNKKPNVLIPVILRYVGQENQRAEKRSTIATIVRAVDRDNWLKHRVRTMIHDFRFLEKLIQRAGATPLFGPNSFPEADRLLTLIPAIEQAGFDNFANVLNRCFVESIEKQGASIGRSQFFSKDLKTNYPDLWHALQRVKLYRHLSMHLNLYDNINADLLEYLTGDLEGQAPNQVQDVFFVLQQRTLDDLLTALQIEINRLS